MTWSTVEQHYNLVRSPALSSTKFEIHLFTFFATYEQCGLPSFWTLSIVKYSKRSENRHRFAPTTVPSSRKYEFFRLDVLGTKREIQTDAIPNMYFLGYGRGFSNSTPLLSELLRHRQSLLSLQAYASIMNEYA